MNKQRLQSLARNRIVLSSLLVILLLAGSVWSLSIYRRNKHVESVRQSLAAEESNEDQFEATPPSAADTYVSDFKYVADVTVSESGFTPANLVVKPQTKLIFKGGDEKPHFLALAPGSPSPRYFDPQIDVTQNSVFQTKFESAGTYSFFDRYNPSASIIVTVSDK